MLSARALAQFTNRKIRLPLLQYSSNLGTDEMLFPRHATALRSSLRPIDLLRGAVWVLSIGVSLLVNCASARADNIDGAWTTVHDWPLITVHAVITPDSRVLSYGTKANGQQTGYFIYDIWDPAAKLVNVKETSGSFTFTNLMAIKSQITVCF